MAYIGKAPVNGFHSKQTLSTDGSTTTFTEDGKQYGIKYSNFVPILAKAVQELSAKNDALEARVKTLEDA